MNILTLDGGGIRGILSARILYRLPNIKFDLYSGTSTGGIIALGLAAGITPSDLVNFYWKKGPSIFTKHSILDRIVHGVFRSQYDNSPLHAALTEVFGSMTLGDLKTDVLIPSFDLDTRLGFFRTWKPKFFTTFDDEDKKELVVDVAMRTSAAPTYFPVYQGYVDGGIVANNPSMCALAQALNEGVKLEDIKLLSISTGKTSDYIDGNNINWGVALWLSHIITMMMEGMVDISDYQCRRIMANRYHRIDPVLRRSVKLDDIESTKFLIESADACDLTETLKWLE